MRLKEKMFPLTPKTIQLIEKQLKKEGITPIKKWHKKFLGFCDETESGDTFCVMFNRENKELYASCAIFNEQDEFDSYLGEVIAINRMALNNSFQNFVRDYSICPSSYIRTSA